MKRNDILLALGSPALLKTMEEALLREGLSVQTAGNGIDAVLTAVKTRPRCVLCGQILAGLDGIKVCRLLRSFNSSREMPVIVSIPDSKPEMRSRALSAGASAVVDYSTPAGEIAQLVRLHSSDSITQPSFAVSSFPRDRILPMAADCIEESLETIETVVRLAGEMKGISSIAEACRKMSAGILGGLGFQRVWIGVLNSSRSRIEAVAYRGRGVTGEAINLSAAGGRLPADIAVSSGSQVVSWECDSGLTGLEWAGSSSFIDTPFSSGYGIAGLIRCDNGLSKKRASSEQLRSLEMAADLLSSFVRYLDCQDRLDDALANTGNLLSSLDSVTVTVDTDGWIREFSGDFSQVPGITEPRPGTNLEDFFRRFPEDVSEDILKGVITEKCSFLKKGVRPENAEGYVDIHCVHGGAAGAKLLLTDRSSQGLLAGRVEVLEFETDTMASLAADLTSEVDVGEICRIISRTVETFYSIESIAVLAPETSVSSFIPESMVVYAVSGSKYHSGALLPGATVFLGKQGETGVLGEAVRKTRITNVPDVLQCDFYLSGLAETRSELAVPMICRGRVVGVVDIQSPERYRFQADDIRRMNNITAFAAGALESALQQTELINMARRDRLTGLHNMTFFEERYPEEFERALRYEYSFSLIMMDIDDFKMYNDAFGHPMGNVLLQKVTRAMGKALRDVDILVRYGGEEFICVLPLTDKQIAVEIAERIRTKVMEANEEIPNADSQPGGFVSLSLGVATFPVDSREKDELVELADQRMYRAKRSGKNKVCHS